MTTSYFQNPIIFAGHSVTGQVNRRYIDDDGFLFLELIGIDEMGFQSTCEMSLHPDFGLKTFRRGRTVRVTCTSDEHGHKTVVEFPRRPPMEITYKLHPYWCLPDLVNAEAGHDR